MELLDKISALEEEASQFGFKWQHADQIMNQIHSECNEIKEHLGHELSKENQIALQEEIGDLLHAVFSLCIFCKLSPRVTLGQSITKFERRLRAVKRRKSGYVCKWITSFLKLAYNPLQTRVVAFFHRS